MHMSNPAPGHRALAALAPGAVLATTAVAVRPLPTTRGDDDLRNAGGHGVRGDADTVLAVDSIGLNADHVRRAAATFDGVRGVAGTVPAAAALPAVRGDAVTPATDPDPLREAVSKVRGGADTPVTTPAVATDPGGAIDTANATALEATDGAHLAVPHVHTSHSLVIRPLHRAAGGDAMAVVAT